MQHSLRRRPGSEVTIDDVAYAAGVSIRTVSRVLNKSVSVSKDTRARVEQIIADLDFRPSPRARGLATGRSYLIGLLHSEHNALVLGDVQRGAANEAARRGYELVVHTADLDDVIGDAVDFVHRSRIDGLLVMAPVSGAPGLADAMKAAGVQACALSAIEMRGFAATMVYNERDGAAEAARHLVDLGHRHIALVGGPNLISAHERRAGFVSGLRAAGLELSGEITGDYGFESGVAGGRALLALEPRPTAIFAASDVMAAGVLRAAAEANVQVPSELSVIGFDCSVLAQMLTPELTAVHRPMGDLAETGVARLIDVIEGLHGSYAQPEITLAIRGSSARAPY